MTQCAKLALLTGCKVFLAFHWQNHAPLFFFFHFQYVGFIHKKIVVVYFKTQNYSSIIFFASGFFPRWRRQGGNIFGQNQNTNEWMNECIHNGWMYRLFVLKLCFVLDCALLSLSRSLLAFSSKKRRVPKTIFSSHYFEWVNERMRAFVNMFIQIQIRRDRFA